MVKGSSDGRKDIFITMLVTLQGVTDRVAAGIASKYPTMGSLLRKYQSVSKAEGELLLKDIIVPNRTSRIGQSISRKVYDAFYGNMDGDKMMNT